LPSTGCAIAGVHHPATVAAVTDTTAATNRGCTRRLLGHVFRFMCFTSCGCGRTLGHQEHMPLRSRICDAIRSQIRETAGMCSA
jgi:hypothetical protein